MQIWEYLADFLDYWMEVQRLNKDIPGIQAAIRYDGKLIYSCALGIADQKGTKLTSSHIFRFASHSKTFTATAIMKLIDDGKLRLDDKIGQYLDFLNPQDKNIAEVTIREVLSHMGGIFRDGPVDWSQFVSEKELQGYFHQHVSILNRNEKYKYSNAGFALLGMVIARVSGQSYEEYVTKNIIKPAQLKLTTPDYVKDRRQYAKGFSSKIPDGKRKEIDCAIPTRSFAAAGGFCSTAEDMSLFYEQLMNGKIIPESRLNELLAPEIDRGNKWVYGLGFMGRKINRIKFSGHTGGFISQSSISLFNRREKLAVSFVMSGDESVSPTPFAEAMLKIFYFFKDNDEAITHAEYPQLRAAAAMACEAVYVLPLADKLQITNLAGDPWCGDDLIAVRENNTWKICRGDSIYGEEIIATVRHHVSQKIKIASMEYERFQF